MPKQSHYPKAIVVRLSLSDWSGLQSIAVNREESVTSLVRKAIGRLVCEEKE